MQLNIMPLAPERVEDFFTFFDHVAFSDHPEWGCGCYCCFFHATDAAVWDKRTPEENSADAREMILTGKLRGLLAYNGDTPVGWLHYDLLTHLPGTKVFYGALATDAPDSAAIVCFTIAQHWRGQGVATRLMEAALADLRAQGAKRVEAYPVTEDDSAEHNYHGPLSLYRKFGFAVVKEADHHALVEKWL